MSQNSHFGFDLWHGKNDVGHGGESGYTFT